MNENTNDQSIWEMILEWLATSGLTIGLILLGAYLVRRSIHPFVARAIKRAIHDDEYATPKDAEQREKTLIGIVSAFLRIFIWIIAGMMILSEFGVDTGPLIAGTSVLGVGLGFGAQSMIKDFISGIFIILENQYRIGDVVEIAGESGVVQAITIRDTILRNLDGEKIYVPNGSIDVTRNMTMGYAGINMDIGVSYDSDIAKVEKVINKVGKSMANDEKFGELIDEAPRFVRVQSFGASEVVVKILGRVKPGKQWEVAGELRKRIKATFDKEGIEIPFPQTVIHKAKN